MPIFEVQARGKSYEIEAPTQDAALSALSSLNVSSAPAAPESPGLIERIGKLWENPPEGPSIIGAVKALYEGAKAPGEALKSTPENPVTTEQLIKPATALAGAVALGGTGAPQGALGSGLVRPKPFSPPPAPAAQPMMEAAQNINVPIPKFLAADDMVTQRTAAALKNIPGAGDKIVKSTQETIDAMGGAAQRVSEGFGTGSAEVAGSAAKDSLVGWVTEGSKSAASRVYDSVDHLVDPQLSRPLYATQKAVSEIMARRANSKIPGKSPAVNVVLDAVQSPGMNYEGLKGLRTFLGEMTPEEMVAKGISKGEANRLYGALTEDLKGTILDGGGPNALAAFEKANTVFSQISDRRKDLSKIIGVKGDAAPEAVFSRLLAMAGSKSSADMSRLLQARKAMGTEAWNEVASAVVSRLGRDPQGNFSPERFLTAYGNLSKSAKGTLFKTTSKDDLASALDDLNTVASAFRERITKFGNPSGTAQNVTGIGLITGAIHDPIKTLGTLLGGSALASALTKPASVRAATQWARAYEQAVTKPGNGSSLLFQIASRNLASVLGGGADLARQLQSIVPARPEDNDVSALRM